MKQLKWTAWILAAALALGASGCSAQALDTIPLGPSEDTSAGAAPTPQQQLEDLGLSLEEASALWAQLPEPRRQALRNASQPPEWLSYLAFDFAWVDRLDRYEAYRQAQPQLTAEEVVVQVNIGLDTPPYENPEPVEEPDSLTALVNQYHILSEDYVPKLVYLEAAYTNQRDRLRPEAYRAFVRMADAAAQDGLRIYNASAYRSYSTQKWVYQRYVRREGAAAADTYSARPGYSEHQTGLALDINTASFSDHFEESEEYAWLVENAGRFGFILRFPEGKEHLTGYQFEPWHYRYVGVAAAQQCWEENWTLEEYIARQPAPGRG